MRNKTLKIGKHIIGDGFPVFVIAEIGINHNGDIGLVRKLIDVAVSAGCHAVKFQKRDPVEAVPGKYRDVIRETPWGIMTYMDYRKRIELGKEDYDAIDEYCRERNILWSASPWDIPSLEFLKQYELPFYKVPSALITHRRYLDELKRIKDDDDIPVLMSTGMTDKEMVKKVVSFLGENNLVLMHAVSTYPAREEDINLNVIRSFRKDFTCPVGYSGHEVGLQISLAAVAVGAVVLERHITLDRSMWGTDQSASLEPQGLARLVRDIRIIENALGSEQKRFLESEKPVSEKLRRVNDVR